MEDHYFWDFGRPSDHLFWLTRAKCQASSLQNHCTGVVWKCSHILPTLGFSFFLVSTLVMKIFQLFDWINTDHLMIFLSVFIGYKVKYIHVISTDRVWLIFGWNADLMKYGENVVPVPQRIYFIFSNSSRTGRLLNFYEIYWIFSSFIKMY